MGKNPRHETGRENVPPAGPAREFKRHSRANRSTLHATPRHMIRPSSSSLVCSFRFVIFLFSSSSEIAGPRKSRMAARDPLTSRGGPRERNFRRRVCLSVTRVDYVFWLCARNCARQFCRWGKGVFSVEVSEHDERRAGVAVGPSPTLVWRNIKSPPVPAPFFF